MNTHKNKKLALNSRLQPYQILKNDDQMLILCLSYFFTTVKKVVQAKTAMAGTLQSILIS